MLNKISQKTKSTYYVIPFTCSSSTCLGEGMSESFERGIWCCSIFCLSGDYMSAYICKSYWNVHIRFVHFTVCKFYLNLKMRKVSSGTFFRQCYDFLGQRMWLGHTMINKVFCKPSDSGAVGRFLCRDGKYLFQWGQITTSSRLEEVQCNQPDTRFSGQWCHTVD